MSAVVLAAVLPASAAPSRTVGNDDGQSGFAGVLDTLGARPDASARRGSAGGASDASDDDGAGTRDASPKSESEGQPTAKPSDVVDLSLLVQAALAAAQPSAAVAVAPAQGPSGAATAAAPQAPTGSGTAMAAGAAARAGVAIPPSGLPSSAASGPKAGASETAPGVSIDPGTPPASEPAIGASAQSVSGPQGMAVTPSRDRPASQPADTDAPMTAAASSSPTGRSTGDRQGGNAASVAPGGVAVGARPAKASLPAAGQPLTASPAGNGVAPFARGTLEAGKQATSESGAAAPGQAPGSSATARMASTGRQHASAAQPDSQASTTAPVAAATTPVADTGAASPPVVQQVAAALRSVAEPSGPSSVSAAAPALAASGVTHVAASAGQGVRNLTVDLDPGHLGPVSITLRLTGETVSVHIAVSNPETLHLLERDRHILTAAIAAMGGSSDDLQLGRDSGASAGFSADGSGRQAAFSSDGSTTGRQTPNHGRQPGRADQEPSHDDATSPAIPATRRLDGSLYL